MAYTSTDFNLKVVHGRGGDVVGYRVLFLSSSRISHGGDGHTGDHVLCTVPTTAHYDTFVTSKINSSWTGNPRVSRVKGIDW